MILSPYPPLGAGPFGEPDHFGMPEPGKPSPHSGCLTPVAIGNHQGYRTEVQNVPAENRDTIAGVEEKGSPLGDIEIAEIKGSVPMPVNAHFAIGERLQGKGTGRGGFHRFTVMHHENKTGSQEIPGDGRTDAQSDMHPASQTTFASLRSGTHIPCSPLLHKCGEGLRPLAVSSAKPAIDQPGKRYNSCRLLNSRHARKYSGFRTKSYRFSMML